MSYKDGTKFSDSVNLGSNPSSPATRNTDVSGVSCVSGTLDRPEKSEQKRTVGRTNVGTAGLYVGPGQGKGIGLAFLRAHVDYQGDDCLIWPLCLAADGYGHVGVGAARYRAHQLMCELAHGVKPTQKHEAAHECRNRACCNPRHLSWKTRKENTADMIRHGTAYVQTSRKRWKLDEEKVAQILALKDTKSQYEIAAMFGISNKTVSKIHLGKAWKDGKKQQPGFKPGDPRNVGWRTNALRRRPRLTRDYVP